MVSKINLKTKKTKWTKILMLLKRLMIFKILVSPTDKVQITKTILMTRIMIIKIWLINTKTGWMIKSTMVIWMDPSTNYAVKTMFMILTAKLEWLHFRIWLLRRRIQRIMHFFLHVGFNALLQQENLHSNLSLCQTLSNVEY